MVHRERIPRLAVALLAVALLAASAATAGAFQIRGIVYGDSKPLAGAAVALADAGSGTPAGATVTGAGGAYAIPVAAGAYDLTVTAAGHEPATVRGIVVAGADVVQDVALVTRPSLTGTVRTAEGIPVAGATLVVFSTGDGFGYERLAGPVTTDGDGRYRFDPAPSGKAHLSVYNYSEGGVLLPDYWHHILWDLEFGGEPTRDVGLPQVATLHGRMAAAGGAAVPGATIEVVQYQTVPNGGGSVVARGLAGSGDGGEYAIRAFAVGTADFTVTPPEGSGFSVVNATLALGGDTARDFTLSRPALTGVVRTGDGAPVAGAEVSVLGSGWNNYFNVLAGPATTGPDGRYVIEQAAAGTGFLEVRHAGGPAGVPLGTRYLARNLEVGPVATVRDVTLPATAVLRGTMRDGAGAPVAGVRVGSGQSIYVADWIAEAEGLSAPTDATGAYEVQGFASNFLDLKVIPPPASGYSEINRSLGSWLWAGRTLDFTLGRLRLSGVLRTQEGTPVPGARITVISSRPATWYDPLTPGVTTGPDGAWEIEPAPGGTAYLEVANHEDGTGLLPRDWSVVFLDYDLAAPAVRDLSLPAVATVRGRTTDANGVSVPDVGVGLEKSLMEYGKRYIRARDARISDAAGEYAARAFALGSTTLTIQPPAGSGFSASLPIGFSLAADRFLNVVLDLDDRVAPVILSGPVVTKVTDTTAVIEWTTDEPARGGLRYGMAGVPGVVVEEERFATAHAVTLTGLVPGAWHAASVFASDLAGNGPVESGGVRFRTLEAPDATPPAFTFGPVVAAITHDAAVVAWATDEACSGSIVYGSEENPGSEQEFPEAATAHRATLEGLAPATAHTLVVSCTDAAGNVATADEIPFTTAPAPDADPPAIVEGPLVVDVTDATATVEWTTDEPATSGVSWNDGTAHGLVSDPALTTAHRVTLTGLLPSTAYELTVSSTDGAGNGPTLGGPVPFTTRAIGDRLPPVIVEGPEVRNVTHQSAVIRWETDEPADGVVEYGTAPDALALRDAHAALTRPHNQAVTGLAAGTTYFFRVCSTDAAGNSGCSGVASFRTDGDADDDADDDDRADVSDLAATYRSDRRAVVSWTTSIPTDSFVQFQAAGGPRRQIVDGAKVLRHRMTLAGLEPGTAYAVRIGGANERGVAAVAPPTAGPATGDLPAPHLTLTTASAPDTAPPVIVEGPAVVELTDTRAVVRWVTDEIADSAVRFGPVGGEFDRLAASIARTTEHRVALTNLRPGTAYRAVVQSGDPAGNPRVESGCADFTTAPLAPLFADSFDDAAAGPDPDWVVGGGAWSVASAAYVSAKAGDDLSTVARFAAEPLAAGVVRAKIRLTGSYRARANGSIVFAVQGPDRYRYVRIEEGRVVIGQRGDIAGVKGGVKKSFAADVTIGRAKVVRVEILPSGAVRVFAGAKLLGSHAFPGAVSGGVGLAASRAQTVFDDVAVWGAAAAAE